jgi:glycosyltransferase involved in cell wall biosynthesis
LVDAPSAHWVVIPALNEEATISKVVIGLIAIGATVCVVDDHSSDHTATLAESAGALVLRSPSHQGYDASISTGVNAAFNAGAALAITCDADGQHRPDDVRRLTNLLLSGEVAVCAGIRDHYNRRIERVLGVPSRWLFGTPDPFCGLKGYTRNFWQDHGPFPRDLMIGTLPLVWAARNKAAVAYIPVQIEARIDYPRFGRNFLASCRLLAAFYRTLWAYVSSSWRA